MTVTTHDLDDDVEHDEDVADDAGLEPDGYQELPPELGTPPRMDRNEVVGLLEYWAGRYAKARVPLEDADLDAPLDVERALMGQHVGTQRRIAQWAPKARSDLTALAALRRKAAEEDAVAIARVDGLLDVRREELEGLDAATGVSEPGRRFEHGSRKAHHVLPIAAGFLEYPVIEPAIGQLLNVFGSMLMLATVSAIVLQIVTYELTGAVAHRWRSSTASRAERRGLAAAAVVGLVLTLVFVGALTSVRMTQLAEDQGSASALPLFIGLQGAFALISVVSGWYGFNPDVTARRRVAAEIDRLQEERDEHVAARELHEQQREGLEGLLAGWAAWVDEHKEATRAAFEGEVRVFRALLTCLLKEEGDEPAIYRLMHTTFPTFTVPVRDADLDEDDDLVDVAPTLTL